MKLCAAQTKPVKGDIRKNIAGHIRMIDLAHSHGADLIIFPELSLTGYEPEQAKELAMDPDDLRLEVFQGISDEKKIVVGVGVPTKNEAGICISMVLFQPQKPRQVYSKKYLHPDEEPYFVSGENLTGLKVSNTHIALAICYELSIPEHPENAFRNGAKGYLASVAKSESGVEKAFKSLSETAKNYSMTVMMANSIGYCDNFLSAGRTAVWNSKGKLLGNLNDKDEGIIIFDTDSQGIFKSGT